jgi:uroporphyrinogen-III synthase
MRRVLVLRPEPGASATVERARSMGMDAVSAPLFTVELVAWKAPEQASFDGLLLTSANAVRCAGEQLGQFRGLKAYAVGEATAEAARDAGLDIAATGDAGVDRLLGSIEGELKLLHLCGEDRREPADARQKITAIAVYRSQPADVPSLARVAGSIALIHSPRAGRRLAELVEDRGKTAIVAISSAAAEAVGDGWECVEIAGTPSDEAMLALAARLCNTSPAK